MDNFYLPYLIDYAHPVAEDIIIICVGICTAILVSAEGQGFAATFLGDSPAGAKDRLHFNLFMHLSLLGTLCFFVAGFGWAKKIKVNTNNFKRYPKLSLMLTRLSGPVANLLMANIAASLHWILSRYGVVDKVFSTIVVVNVTMAVYSLIPLPPLPGSVVWRLLGSDDLERYQYWQLFKQVSPVLILILFLAMRLTGFEGLSVLFNPVVEYLSSFALSM